MRTSSTRYSMSWAPLCSRAPATAGIVCISVSSTRDALNDNFGKILFNRRNTVKREFSARAWSPGRIQSCLKVWRKKASRKRAALVGVLFWKGATYDMDPDWLASAHFQDGDEPCLRDGATYDGVRFDSMIKGSWIRRSSQLRFPIRLAYARALVVRVSKGNLFGSVPPLRLSAKWTLTTEEEPAPRWDSFRRGDHPGVERQKYRVTYGLSGAGAPP